VRLRGITREIRASRRSDAVLLVGALGFLRTTMSEKWNCLNRILKQFSWVTESFGARSVANPMSTNNGRYAQRIDRVIDYVRGNLDHQVNLKELARVACLSEFHFHRIFGAVSGETLNNFTNRLRLEKAARLLRYSDQRVTDIALDCGFSSSATFSRSFRSGFDTSPSQFRKSGEIKKSKICKELFPEDKYGLPMSAEEKRAAFPVRLIDIPERQVAYIRVTNAFELDRLLAAVKTMTEWAKSQGIFSQGILFGMTVYDPHVTPKHLYRYEVCFASSFPFECMEVMSKQNAGHAIRCHKSFRRYPYGSYGLGLPL